MRIVLAHNYYQQPGGEDTVFCALSTLLRGRGNDVAEYIDDNHRIAGMKPVSVAVQTIWSQSTYKKIAKLIRNERPDIVHFHNIFPLISPAAYYACREAGVPVVQSLDNPRLLCPSANFYRNERLCLDCANKKIPWPGILHACYHKSRIQTCVVAAMLTTHRVLKTWQDRVDVYLVATDFYRKIFVSYGFPEARIAVKPHFIPKDPGIKTNKKSGSYALFLARLDPEKGVRTMLKAWMKLDIPLKIRGSGQLEQEVRHFILDSQTAKIEIIGRLAEDELGDLVKNARFLVWPSEGYYETFGMAAVECYAAGVPVIASRIGVMTEVVRDGVTGLLFNPGDPDDLAAKVSWLWNHPEECAEMGHNARREYEEKYTPERNYQMVMDIYTRAMTEKQG
jgi:glycosyltransferase involved in cell wall biosynthesis